MRNSLGERVTIHPFRKRRYHHGLVADCVALPAAHTLVQNRKDKAWYKLADINSRHSVNLYALYQKQGSATSGKPVYMFDVIYIVIYK